MAHTPDHASGGGASLGAAISRRRFIQYGAGTGAGLLVWRFGGGRAWAQATGGAVLDPLSIPKYVDAAGDSAGDAADAQPPPEKREFGRLLRDRGARVRAAHPAGQHGAGADQSLELRIGKPPGHVQLPGVHDRGRLGHAGAREVDQRPRPSQAATSARTCSRSTRRCIGPTRPAARAIATRTSRTRRPTGDRCRS